MITRTEVLQAIARCEKHAGFASIDKALVHPDAISRGDLLVLVEAAKCARYKNVFTGMEIGKGISDSHMALNDR